MLVVWPALGVAVAGVVCGVAYAVRSWRQAWRGFKSLSSAVGKGLDDIAASSAEIDTHLTLAGQSSERLSATLERLRLSRARLDVLLAALREARTALERAVPFLGGG